MPIATLCSLVIIPLTGEKQHYVEPSLNEALARVTEYVDKQWPLLPVTKHIPMPSNNSDKIADFSAMTHTCFSLASVDIDPERFGLSSL